MFHILALMSNHSKSVQHNLNMKIPFYRLFKRFVNSWATDDEKMNLNEKLRHFIKADTKNSEMVKFLGIKCLGRFPV